MPRSSTQLTCQHISLARSVRKCVLTLPSAESSSSVDPLRMHCIVLVHRRSCPDSYMVSMYNIYKLYICTTHVKRMSRDIRLKRCCKNPAKPCSNHFSQSSRGRILRTDKLLSYTVNCKQCLQKSKHLG